MSWHEQLVPTNGTLARREQADRLEAEEAARDAEEWARGLLTLAREGWRQRADAYIRSPRRGKRSLAFARRCSLGDLYCPHRPACRR